MVGNEASDLKVFGEKKFSRHVDSNISIGLRVCHHEENCFSP
jgi:hypothetical protein